jgi:replicative DNA helicase
MRQVVAIVVALLASANQRGECGDDLLEHAQAQLASVRGVKLAPVRRIGEIAQDVAREVLANEDRLARGEPPAGGIPSGLRSLDTSINGHPLGLITLVIGRPGMGKSTYALGALEHASNLGFPGLLVSYEDPEQVTAARGIAKLGRVATNRLRAGGLSRLELAATIQGANALRGSSWWILAAAGKTTDEVVRTVRRFVREHGVRHVHIDYLQLMDWPKGAKDENDGIGRNLKTLSNLAATEQIAVVVYSQLSRENLKRENKRPTLGDIRGSGVGEQVGKLVLGLHYEPEYTAWAQVPATERSRYQDEDEWRRSLEILVLKDVAGESRKRVIVEWDRAHATITDRAVSAEGIR